MDSIVAGAFLSFLMETGKDGILYAISDRSIQAKIEMAFKSAVKKRIPNISIAAYEAKKLPQYLTILQKETDTKIQADDPLLMAYFKEELKNHSLTYLFLLDIQIQYIHKIISNVFTGAKIYDATVQKGHFNVFPYSSLRIEDIFIEPNCKYMNTAGDMLSLKNCFLPNVLELLKNCQYLFVTGGYGAGKTFLSKYLQLHLIANKQKTVYLYSDHFSELCQDPGLLNNNSDVFIFIDSMDELSSSNSSDREVLLYKIRDMGRSSAKLHFIVNFRTIEKKDDNILNRPYLTSLFDIFTDSSNIIDISYFDNTFIKKWLDKYSAIKNIELDFSVVKHSDLLLNSLKIPLLTFIYASETNPQNPNQNIYSVFKNFVNKTVKGKFQGDNIPNQFFIKHRIDEKKYLDFLTKVAFESVKNQDVFEDSEFDSNEHIWKINETIVKNVIVECFGNIQNDEEGYLKCYFFAKKNDNWYFRDNNIICYLIATKILEMLKNVSTGRVPLKELLGTIEVSSLNLVIYGFIFTFLDRMCEVDRGNIVNYIKSLIINGDILDAKKIKTKDHIISKKKLFADTFLFVIFLKYYRAIFINSFAPEDINFIFKRISHYYSFAKHFDKNITTIIRRFFSDIQILNAEFRRINLKGYNFDRSIFSNVKFLQDKITQTRFNHTKHSNTEFNLCLFEDNECNHLAGDIEFVNCFIHNCKLKVNAKTKIRFIGCKIQMLLIASDNNTLDHAPEIILEDSIIYQLTFKQNTFHVKLNTTIIKSDIKLSENSRVNILFDAAILEGCTKYNEQKAKIEEAIRPIIRNFKPDNQSRIGFFFEKKFFPMP